MKVRTRIAPSPTGQDLHIGNLYTGLFNWAFARQNNGQFVVRIEDTDQNRKIKNSELTILKTLKQYGLDYDESIDKKGKYGPYYQSKRLDIYQKYIKILIDKGAAYYCTCSKKRLEKLRNDQQKKGQVPKYDKHCLKQQSVIRSQVSGGRPFVIRLNVPQNKEISFNDLVRGKITFSTNDIDDQVLIKSDGYPTYHFAVVVDDFLMKISHVIRGEEWISSTPKHIILYQAFNWSLPVYIHQPLLRNPDKSKLSKRKSPVWASWYLDQGYLSEAVLNYLALMGWSHPQQKEIFSIDEFIKVLDLKRIQSVGPIFDINKLNWINGEYIRKTQKSKLKAQIFQFYKGKYSEELIKKTIPLVQERIKTLAEYDDYCQFFIKKPEKFDIDLSTYVQMFKHLNIKLLTISNENWKADILGEKMLELAKELNISNSKFFMAVRVAIAGKKVTPPLNESMEILGKEECLERLKSVFAKH